MRRGIHHRERMSGIARAAMMPTEITEFIVEQAALDWLKGLGYEILSGPAIAPGETAAERSDYPRCVAQGVVYRLYRHAD